MAQENAERRLIIRSRLAANYDLTESGLKNIQHLIADWLPRAVYCDLTDDTARLDVVIRRNFTGKAKFVVEFIRADSSYVKACEYTEERITGIVCDAYLPERTRYHGQYDSYDNRLVIYATASTTARSG